jgi:lipoate-protein ligase A
VAKVVRRRASIEVLHALAPFGDDWSGEPEVWVCEPTDAAFVLGSRQAPAIVDADACARAGLSIVRRRSGGGAVLVRPDAVCWIDLVLPHGVAPDDVRGSMIWAGERWLESLAPVIPDVGVTVHRGGLIGTPWSDLVCFAGIGPGELILADVKLVGLSQRRSRDGLRIQGLVHRAPIVDDLAALIVAPQPDVPLLPPAIVPALGEAGAVEALAARLVQRITFP